MQITMLQHGTEANIQAAGADANVQAAVCFAMKR